MTRFYGVAVCLLSFKGMFAVSNIQVRFMCQEIVWRDERGAPWLATGRIFFVTLLLFSCFLQLA